MKLGTKCTTCGERIERGGLAKCEDCGTRRHANCADFERAFECQRCGDETWIGAVEF